MKKRREIIESLRYTRNQRDKATAEMEAALFESAEYDTARVNRLLYIGWCLAYENVLDIEPEAQI